MSQFPGLPPGPGGGGAADPVTILLSSPTAVRPCYSFSGQGNNVNNPTWGAANDHLLRPEGHRYADDDWSQMPQGVNPRTISNALSHETCAQGTLNAEQCLNDWFWVWGQAIDHDLAQVPVFPKQAPTDHELDTNISITADGNDPFLANRKLPHRRSFVEPSQPLDQINIASAFLDCSQVYGASVLKADSVRTFQNGMLKSTRDGFMPILSSSLNLNFTNVPTFDELGHPSNKDQFLCADMRCNQHAPMAAMQTIFVREHNRIALALARSGHPAYNNDESIYQAARASVIAMTQAITFNEFLPLALGPFGVPTYTGYKPNTRTGITNAFITAGFRLMHSMVGCDFKEMTSQGQVLRSVSFATAFFDSTWIRGAPAQPNRFNRETNAYQTVTNALAFNPSTHMDHKVAPVLRSVLFSGVTTPRGRRPDVAFDVIASDILRGRDHGLLDYRHMRRKLGWSDIRSVNDITINPERRLVLQSIYGNDLDNIDLFVGMLTEDPLEGAVFGPVTSSVIKDQFERIRDGDRCWFENQFNGPLLAAFRNTRLKDLVDRNFNNPNNPFASEITVGTVPVRPTVELSPIQAHAAGVTPVVIRPPVPGSGTNNIAIDGVVPNAATIPIPRSPPTSGTNAPAPVLNVVNNNVSAPSDRDNDLAVAPVDANEDAGHVVGLTSGVIAGSTLINNNPTNGESSLSPAAGTGGVSVGVLSHHRNRHAHNSPAEIDDSELVNLNPVQRTLSASQHEEDRHADDEQLSHRDIAHKRYNERRSRLDNGSGVRTAGPLDDIVGFRCDGPDCHPVALESDPIIDEEIIAIAQHIREQRRQQQQNHDLLALNALHGISGQPQQSLSLQNSHVFTTMQVQPSTPAPAPPQGFTTLVLNQSGFQQLSPAPGIRQAGVRSPLASVQPTVLVENIFVTPRCRR